MPKNGGTRSIHGLTWFNRTSGIADNKGRVGASPNRIEGEKMRLEGYTKVGVSP